MKILLHSSKTMKTVDYTGQALSVPEFYLDALEIHKALAALKLNDLQKLMNVSEKLAAKVKTQVEQWSTNKDGFSPAALSFRGDIYSGLSADKWGLKDMAFAQEHLLIMSGLYGLLRPLDGIKPYRLEMGCPLMIKKGINLTKFWQARLLRDLSPHETYVNLTAYEYFKTIEKQLKPSSVISPKFLTLSPKSKQPTFVTVHAKIARGSFANWLIKNRATNVKDILEYNDLNYHYEKTLSTATQPVFVCDSFGGLGLSIRLK